MPTYKIPNQNGQVRQLNLNDTTGELWSTFNIDLHTNPGKIKLARPFESVATDTIVASDPVEAFSILSTYFYATTSDHLVKTISPYDTWANVSNSINNSDSKCDMTSFHGQLVRSTSTNVDAYDGATRTSGWWTARGNPSLTSGYPHILEVLRIGAETLAVTDGPNIYGYTGGIGSGTITSVTMDLPSNFVATCIKGTIRNAYIGTYTIDDTEAYVFQWDGTSTNYAQSYPTGAKCVLAMEVVDDVPIIVTELGEIKKFNNAGFTTIAQFPFAGKPLFADGVETGLISANNGARPIHPKGIKRHGNNVYIFAAFQSSSSELLDERTPNGVWCLDLTTNSLSHIDSPENESLFEYASPVMLVNDPNGRLYVGGRRVSGEYGIWRENLDPSATNYGYFVTSEIVSSDVRDIFDAVVIKAQLDTDDKITVKYRTSKDPDYPITITDATWTGVNENTFTSTDADMATVKSRFEAGNFDEIEVLVGQGAGRLAHITNITYSNPTYTVTIDEQIGAAGQTSYIRFDNWQKVPKTMVSTNGDVTKFGIGKSGTFGQFKIALAGKAGLPEIREVLIKTNPKEQ